MRKKSCLNALLVIGCVALPTVVLSHPGGLDANGCHHNKKTGMYECHEGRHAGQVFASREDMERGVTGMPAGRTTTDAEDTRKVKEKAAAAKAEREKAKADETAEKAEIKSDLDKEKARVEAKAAKEKAKAEKKAAKRKAKAEEKAEKAKAKADEKAP